MSDEETLYIKLGGDAALTATAELLTTKLSKDDLLKDYFVNIDMVSHRIYLKKFLALITGGPKNYDGRDMKEAHGNLGIQDNEFTHLMTLIRETLNELGVQQDVINTFCSAAEGLRESIVSK